MEFNVIWNNFQMEVSSKERTLFLITGVFSLSFKTSIHLNLIGFLIFTEDLVMELSLNIHGMLIKFNSIFISHFPFPLIPLVVFSLQKNVAGIEPTFPK